VSKDCYEHFLQILPQFDKLCVARVNGATAWPAICILRHDPGSAFAYFANLHNMKINFNKNLLEINLFDTETIIILTPLFIVRFVVVVVVAAALARSFLKCVQTENMSLKMSDLCKIYDRKFPVGFLRKYLSRCFGLK
jgi:hypothetical protein